MTKADGTVIINTKVDTSGMNTGLKQIQGGLGGLGSALKKLGSIIAVVFSVKKIAEFAASCIELGSDLDEVQNVVQVTFGDKMTGVIEKFAKEAATNLGLSELAAKQYTSTLGAMYKSMGFGEEAAAGMSMKMTELAADMASFYNLDADTAFQKIRSGISGETEPLKQLGINLSEANLEEYRLAQGIQTSYKAMSQQDKALLRYNYLLSVTKDAQGDFARTSNSWANQVKILRLQFDSIRADLGQGFIAIFTPVLQVINRVLQGIAKLASAFKAFTQLITGKKASSGGGGSGAANLGVDETMPEVADAYTDAADSADDYADATQSVAKATKQAAKEANKYLSPLDEINRYTKENADSDSSAVPGVSGGGKTKTKTPAASTGSGTGASTLAPVDFGQLEQGDTVVDKLAQKMKDLYDTIVKGCQPAINALKNLWDNGLKKLGEFAFNALLDFYNLFLKPVGAWVMGEGIPRFVNAINDGLMKVNWEAIRTGLQNLWEALAPFAIKVGEGLLWLWENVLVPFGTWTANEVVPRFLETLATAVTLVNNILVALQPAWQWFWDNVLGPIASWTGGIFLTIWDGINAALGWFAQWCADNPEAIRQITENVLMFFAAWKTAELMDKIAGLIGKITGAGGLMGALSTLAGALGPGGLIAVAIGAAVAAGIWLYENWDLVKEKAELLRAFLASKWELIKTKLTSVWNGIVTFLTGVWNGFVTKATTIFGNVKKAIEDKWTLVTTNVKTVWNSITTFLAGIWNGFTTKATTIFGNVKKAIEDKWTLVTTGVKTVWNGITTFLAGIWNGFVTTAKTKFGDVKDKVASAWKSVYDKTNDKWGKVKTKVTNAAAKIKETADDKFEKVKTTVGDAWTAIKDGVTNTFGGEEGIVAKVKGAFGDIKTGIVNVFTGEDGVISKFGGYLDDLIAKVLGIKEGIDEAFGVVFGGIVDLVKTPINSVIGFINYMIEGIINGLNDVIEGFNSIGFDMPSWLGGASFHPNIPLIPTDTYTIPLLAKGAVIPPNAPFLAMLGDQRRGTNIEAPLETIQQAVANVIGSGGDQHITIYLDGKVVYENVLKRGRDQQIWSGHNPFELT